MDVLSEMLERVELHDVLPVVAELTAPWGFHLPMPDANNCPPPHPMPAEAMKLIEAQRLRPCAFWAVVEGRARLELDKHEPLELAKGDLVMISQPMTQRARDRHETPTRSILEIAPPPELNRTRRLKLGGDGEKTTLVFGIFTLQSGVGPRLADGFPAVLRLSAAEDQTQSWLPQILKLITTESAELSAGSMAVITRLVQIMVCQAVRKHVRHLPHNGRSATPDWLRARLDDALGPLLRAVHQRIGEPWTVETMAEEVAMSRSVFAARFASMVGVPPLQYLSSIRMQRACELLSSSKVPIKQISRDVGYESEAAFSTAFRRRLHMSPQDFRKASWSVLEHRRQQANELLLRNPG